MSRVSFSHCQVCLVLHHWSYTSSSQGNSAELIRTLSCLADTKSGQKYLKIFKIFKTQLELNFSNRGDKEKCAASFLCAGFLTESSANLFLYKRNEWFIQIEDKNILVSYKPKTNKQSPPSKQTNAQKGCSSSFHISFKASQKTKRELHVSVN